jgi:hypothetical protein
MSLIRKISVGPDYKNAMHFIVGQDVLGNSHKISSININEKGDYLIHIKNDSEEVVLWKTFTVTVPISIEHNIDF